MSLNVKICPLAPSFDFHLSSLTPFIKILALLRRLFKNWLSSAAKCFDSLTPSSYFGSLSPSSDFGSLSPSFYYYSPAPATE